MHTYCNSLLHETFDAAAKELAFSWQEFSAKSKNCELGSWLGVAVWALYLQPILT